MNKLLIFIFMILLAGVYGCSPVPTIGLLEKDFNKRPERIIWIQLAGFTEEHLAMLRFGKRDSSYITPFEQATCVGKLWNYSLYHLRPNASMSFLTQLNGSKNIRGTCDDFKVKPFWYYFQQANYSVGIFETPIENARQSLSRSLDCKVNKSFLADTTLWRMQAIPAISATPARAESRATIVEHKESKTDPQQFHYLDKKRVSLGGVVYDRSCQQKICHTSIYTNIKSLYQRFFEESDKSVFIIRDFSFAKHLEARRFSEARETLAEIEKVLDYFISEHSNRSGTLVLLSSAAAQNIEYPTVGRKWIEFEQSGKNVLYRRKSLMSVVLSKGASAENFCGIYDESELFTRVLWQAPRRNINWPWKD